MLSRSLRENLHELSECSFNEKENSYQEKKPESSLQWVLHIWLTKQGWKSGWNPARGCNVWLGQNHKEWGKYQVLIDICNKYQVSLKSIKYY